MELNLEENPNQVEPNQVENLIQEVENRQGEEPKHDENHQIVALLDDNGDIPEENVVDQPINVITVNYFAPVYKTKYSLKQVFTAKN